MIQLDVLAFGAHPDDVELNAGGTIATLVKQGLRVGIIDLTRGEKGTRGTPEKRFQEARKAQEILGLVVRENLAIPDNDIANTAENRTKVMEVLRKYKPSLCIIGADEDRHPDHGYATTLLKDAFFYSGLRKHETELDGEPQASWRPTHVLQYMHDRPFSPHFIFDVTEMFDTKLASILAYDTQFHTSSDSPEPQTYISTSAFFDQIKAKARYYGHQIGVTYGEPFQYYGGPIPMHNLASMLSHKPMK